MCFLSCFSFLVSFSETQNPSTVQSTSAPGTSTNHASPPTSVNSTLTTVHQNTSATTTANVSFTSQAPLTPSTPTQPPNQTSPSPPAQTTTTNQTSSHAGSSTPSVQVTSGPASTSGDTTIIPTSAGQTPTVTWLCTKVYAPQTCWGIYTSLKCHLRFHSVKLQKTNFTLREKCHCLAARRQCCLQTRQQYRK